MLHPIVKVPSVRGVPPIFSMALYDWLLDKHEIRSKKNNNILPNLQFKGERIQDGD
jgi:hypothetical protein